MGDSGEVAGMRYQIDEIDARILAELNERARLAVAIGEAKGKTDGGAKADMFSPSHNLQVLERIQSFNTGPLSNSSILSIYREIFSASASLQQDLVIGYPGPSGTLSEQAAIASFGRSAKFCALSSINDVVRAVERRAVTHGVVPWESSDGGIDLQTIDALSSFTGQVRAQLCSSVRHALMARCPKGRVRRIYGHAEALTLCHAYLTRVFPDAELISSPSTAAATSAVCKDEEAAVIAAPVCAEQYDLSVLEEPVNDDTSMATRFFIIGNHSDIRTGKDRSLVSFSTDTRQRCALSEALAVFHSRHVHVVRVDSRPIPSRPWQARYFVEFCGHLTDTHVLDVIHQLHRWCIEVRVHGSYSEVKSAAHTCPSP